MQETLLNQLKKIERDENYLIKGFNYKFTSDGLVDWRSAIPSQFFYINNDTQNRDKIEKKYGKPYKDIDIIADNVQDSDLVILLGGIKYLARLRGFKSVSYNIVESNPEYVSINCSIVFCGNYETEFRDIEYQDNACATLSNTSNFATKYLVEICTNRAFCRTVRSFCGLNVVSKEELGASNEQEQPKTTVNLEKQIKLLQNIMEAKNVKWKNIENKLREENRWKDSYTGIDCLPKDVLFEFIERLKKMPAQLNN